MANTIKFDYKIQAKYLQMIAEDAGLVSKNPVKENGEVKDLAKMIFDFETKDEDFKTRTAKL